MVKSVGAVCMLSSVTCQTVKSKMGLPLHKVTVLQNISLFPSSRTSDLP